MRHLRNDRGSVLIYVILVLAVLLWMTPTLSSMISARAASDVTLKQSTLANQMTVSAMETIVAYINTRIGQGDSLGESLMSYPGWTNRLPNRYTTMELSDGNWVTHSQLLCLDAECAEPAPAVLPANGEETDYYIRVRTVAGDTNGNHLADERQARLKDRVKRVRWKPGGGSGEEPPGGVIIVDLDDPNREPLCLPADGTMLYGGDSGSTGFKPLDIQGAIDAHMNRQTNKVEDAVSSHQNKPGAVSCEAHYNTSYCSLAQLTSLIQSMDTSKPRYVKVKRINQRVNGTLGSSAASPVVLIVDQLLAPSLDTLTLYGDLVVTGKGYPLAVDHAGSNFSVRVHQGRDENGTLAFGNIYMQNSGIYSGAVTLEAKTGYVYIDGDFRMANGNANIHAKQITINGTLKTVAAYLNISASSSNITVGSLDLSNGSAQLNSFQGDLFVRDNFTVANNVGISVDVEGVIAVGNNVTIPAWHSGSVNAQGKQSSLYIPGVSEACS